MPEERALVAGENGRKMLAPVRCNHCQRIYDLCAGEPVARYADCTVYKTPCCGRTVDDRPDGWVAFPAFTKLTAGEAEAIRHGKRLINRYGDTFGVVEGSGGSR